MNGITNTLEPRSKTESKSKSKSKRKFSKQYTAYLIHSFFGLKISLILTLVLASGTLAVISQEIDWLLIPEMRVEQGDTRMNEGTLLDKLQAAYPDHGLSSFQPNENSPHTAASAFYNDSEGGFRNAWIDPYTGEVKGDTPLLTIGSFLSFLHATLFLPVIGRSVVNAFGLFTIISLVAGLIAVPKFWRYFFIKPRTGNTRVFLADCHKLVGLWSIWFLLIIGVSGTWWFYKVPLVLYADAPKLHEPYPRKPLLDYAELDKFGNTAPTPLSAEKIISIVKEAHSDMRIGMLSPPQHNSDPYEVFGSKGEWLVNGIGSNIIHLNPYDGTIINQFMVKDYTPMQRFDRAMAPLHYGTWAETGISDLVVKFIWFVFGAAMTALAVTGLIINYKRTKRASRIAARYNPTMRKVIKSWRVVRPWGGPMGIFKYLNVLMLAGVGFGTGVVLTLAAQGVTNAGYEYTEKKIGPWDIKVNAFAGFLEKDLPPIRAGLKTNFSVKLPKESLDSIKFIYARVGKPRTLRAPGTLIHGPVGAKSVTFRLPKRLKDNAELWITAITWEGDVHQVSWPLMPDGKETLDVR